jgi:hypothetical protein
MHNLCKYLLPPPSILAARPSVSASLCRQYVGGGVNTWPECLFRRLLKTAHHFVVTNPSDLWPSLAAAESIPAVAAYNCIDPLGQYNKQPPHDQLLGQPSVARVIGRILAA